tara:strand:- start:18624 stop:18749 length:126 start_codon:yes stop_codon:yes gene_type:complete
MNVISKIIPSPALPNGKGANCFKSFPFGEDLGGDEHMYNPY